RRIGTMGEQTVRREQESGDECAVHGDRHRDHPLEAPRGRHPIAQHIGDFHDRSAAFVTKPTCSTPAAFSRSVTSAISPRLISRSPLSVTSFFAAPSIFCR